MENEILEKLNAKISKKQTSEQFMYDVACYEMPSKDFTILFSEVDFRTGDDLREKDLISFYIKKDRKRMFVNFSKDFIKDCSIDVLSSCLRGDWGPNALNN